MNIDAISDSEDVLFDCPTIASPRHRIKAPRAKIPNRPNIRTEEWPESIMPKRVKLRALKLPSCSSKIQVEKKPRSKSLSSQKLEVPKQNGGPEIQTGEKPRIPKPRSKVKSSKSIYSQETSKLPKRGPHHLRVSSCSEFSATGSINLKPQSSGRSKSLSDAPQDPKADPKVGLLVQALKVKKMPTITEKSISDAANRKFLGPNATVKPVKELRKKGPHHLRVSSCSEFSATGSSNLKPQSSGRSKSLSDASQDPKADPNVGVLVQALKVKKMPTITEKSISDAANRKFLGPNATVKPVKELRKIVPPPAASKENRMKKR